MTNRATFTLDGDAYAFLMEMGGSNKSAYINWLLKQEKLRRLEEAALRANREEAEDAAYQEALKEWDVTLTDGLSS